MSDGLLIVDKPAGFTSHDVVAKLRGIARTRRVGHAGTLDPMATGVLVIGVERATRLLGHLALTDKAYTATIRLGISTVTDDAEGEPLESVDASHVTDAEIATGVAQLTGLIQQRPSSVSAIKVNGVRAYSRVREGEDVVLDARPVTVSRFEVVARRDEGAVVDLDVECEVSSGTYIRALARDLGAALGVGGHLTALRRTRVGPFGLEGSTTLSDLQARRDAGESLPLISPADAVRQCYPVLVLDDASAAKVLHGNPIPYTDDLPSDGPVGLLHPADGRLLALSQRAQRREGDVLAHLLVLSN